MRGIGWTTGGHEGYAIGMNVAVIGNGRIGAALAAAWKRAGHAVLVGVRAPGVGEIAIRLAARAEVIALAIPFTALDSVLAELGALERKTIIDCTNPMGAPVPEGSAARKIAIARPLAHVVKSFNGQGFETLALPLVDGTAASNFYCGDDAGAKATVRQLVTDIGLDPVDAGALDSARALEALAGLWFATTAAFGTRRTAFRVLRESPK